MKEKEMKVAQDIWEKYGFRGNPFDTTPLTNHKNSPLPIEEGKKAFYHRHRKAPSFREGI